jgi:hypothetical protein
VAKLLLAQGAAVGPAEGELGIFTTALVYRCAAQNAYQKRDTTRASEFLERARSSFLATQAVADKQAHEYSGHITRIRMLNALALVVAQAQANIQAQTSLAGVGTALAPQASASSDVSLRDLYRRFAAWSAGEAARMGTIQTCVSADAGATHACFPSTSQERR